MGPDWISAFWRSCSTMLRAFWKLARQLFHEATGTFFALFALYGAVAAWKQGRQPQGQWITVIALIYSVMMAFFAFSAFRSASRVR
jgi:glycerol uptake facilitator-like aquaporin